MEPDATSKHLNSPSNPERLIRTALLPFLTGSDLARRRLPWMEARSPENGSGAQPLVWLTACCHGDEVGGMVVVQEFFKALRHRPLLRGTVRAFPLMNPIGFDQASRLLPASGEDLNRAFPGDPNGSLAARIAHFLFEPIVSSQPKLVLDLHNDWLRSIPYSVIDASSSDISDEVRDTAIRHANHIGLPVIGESESVRGSLTHSLLARGIPAITLELGESHVVNEEHVLHAAGSIWSALAALDMVGAPSPFPEVGAPASPPGKILRYTDRPLATKSGVARFLCHPGQHVRAGEALVRITNAFGRLQETLRAPAEALVLGHADSSLAFPGTPLLALATSW